MPLARLKSTRLLALLALLFALVSGAAQAQENDAINLPVGGKKTIQLPDIASAVKISRAGVIEVSRGETKKKLVIRGKGGGTTNLTVDTVDGRSVSYMITVSDKSMLRQAYGQAAAIPGVQASMQEDRIVVGGMLRSQSAYDRLQALKRNYGGLIVDSTQKDLPSNNTIVSAINNVLTENDIANIQAASYGRLIVLVGSPKDEMQHQLALRIAKMIHPEIEDQTSKDSNGAPPIAIEVMFIEVQRKNDKTIGAIGSIGQDISNQNSGTETTPDKEQPTPGAVLGAPGGGGQYGKLHWQVGSLTSFLKLIQTKSVSRVLSNPKLVTRSGQEATFHSGGTFFLETGRTQAQGVTVIESSPIDYGIKLGVLPKLDTIGQIDTKIGTSITDLGAKIAGKESITKSQVETVVTIKDGQSILLTGLVRKTEKKKVDRVPLLADIPVVGELFKSRQSLNEETELLVLVTINRIQPSDHKIDAADKLWQGAGDDVKFSAFD